MTRGTERVRKLLTLLTRGSPAHLLGRHFGQHGVSARTTIRSTCQKEAIGVVYQESPGSYFKKTFRFMEEIWTIFGSSMDTTGFVPSFKKSLNPFTEKITINLDSCYISPLLAPRARFNL